MTIRRLAAVLLLAGLAILWVAGPAEERAPEARIATTAPDHRPPRPTAGPSNPAAPQRPAAAPGHFELLLELPPDELQALVDDPATARTRVQGWLATQAESEARTELLVSGVPIDDPAALERALSAARAARPR